MPLKILSFYPTEGMYFSVFLCVRCFSNRTSSTCILFDTIGHVFLCIFACFCVFLCISVCFLCISVCFCVFSRVRLPCQILLLPHKLHLDLVSARWRALCFLHLSDLSNVDPKSTLDLTFITLEILPYIIMHGSFFKSIASFLKKYFNSRIAS